LDKEEASAQCRKGPVMTEKRKRGFAGMDQQKQREIASKGGKAAHAKGTAHKFTPEEAAEAGRKGGKAAHAKGTAHEFSSQEAAEAGRKGGSARESHASNRASEPERRAEPMPAMQPPMPQSQGNQGSSPSMRQPETEFSGQR
jgi:general stress protein YciG